jgi:hypothetical protein
MDQYVSSTPGRTRFSAGKERESYKLRRGTILYDHATGYIHVRHQTTLTAESSMEAKHEFERFADSVGRSPKENLADNHPFQTDLFKTDCQNQGQVLLASGVGAHHQNGAAERAIGTIMNLSRSMLIRFILHWPHQHNLNLWPFAVDHGVYVWNHTPKPSTRLSPIELFTGVSFSTCNHMKRLHVFGSPTYVLDPTLQDGKKLPKWTKRSRLGVYLGNSPMHFTTVSLILNPSSGYVSPQYHCVHDDTFSTVPLRETDLDTTFSQDAPNQALWQQLVMSGYERHQSLQDVDPCNPVQLPPDVDRAWPDLRHVKLPRHNQIDILTEGVGVPNTSGPLSIQSPPQQREKQETTSQSDTTLDAAPPLSPVVTSDTPETPSDTNPSAVRRQLNKLTDASGNDQEIYKGPQLQTRLQHRQAIQSRRPPSVNLHQFSNFNSADNPRFRLDHLNRQHLMTLKWQAFVNLCQHGMLGAFATEARKHTIEGYLEEFNPALLATLANKEDHPTWEEAMNGPLSNGYWKAAQTEAAC